MPDNPRGGGSDPKKPIRRLGRGLESLLSLRPVEMPAEFVAKPPDVPPALPIVAPPASSAPSTAFPAFSHGTDKASVGTSGAGSTGNHPRSSSAVPPPVPQVVEVSVPSDEGSDSLDGPKIVTLSVSSIRPNARQPRQDFDEASLQSLAESIRTAGLMQPVIVRTTATHGVYELVAGERRWRAVQRLGLTSIPAVVHEVSDQIAAEWAIIENVQREDLNPIERAQGLRRLVDEFALTHQELADKVGLDRTSVTNLLRLCELDPFTLDAVRKRRLSQGHAKALLAITRVDARQALAAAAIGGDWSVRELERRVQQALEPSAPAPRTASASSSEHRPSPHVADLERRLGDHLGTRVTIQLGRKKGTGRLSVDFYTLDQFDGLLARLGFEQES